LVDKKFNAIFISGALYYLDLNEVAQWFNDHLEDDGVLIAIETLGDNLPMHIYRKLRNYFSDHRDHKTLNNLLRRSDFTSFGKHFKNTKLTYFDLTTLAGTALTSLPKLQHYYLKVAAKVDRFFLNKQLGLNGLLDQLLCAYSQHFGQRIPALIST
jgi:hypothetical protein